LVRRVRLAPSLTPIALLLGLLILAACAEAGPTTTAPPPPAIRVAAAQAPLNTLYGGQTRVGRFTYAGGLALTSPDTTRLHGLSDLKVWPDGRMLAESDEGDLFEGRLVLDNAGRPVAILDAKLAPLPAEGGGSLPALGKREADAEGLAVLANGDMLISLETDDRILLYPHDGGPPRRAPSPPEAYPPNLGMEALAQDPQSGPDAYVVGGEASGQTWICRLSSGCTRSFRVEKPKTAGLSAVAMMPGGGQAYLLRSFGLVRGFRVTLRITDAQGATLDELHLAAPLTVDNFEGVAALPQPDGAVRFYLISDDNFSHLERTLLLAFDWRPAEAPAKP
jgi:hypothetical protein